MVFMLFVHITPAVPPTRAASGLIDAAVAEAAGIWAQYGAASTRRPPKTAAGATPAAGPAKTTVS